jgi:zinc protease
MLKTLAIAAVSTLALGLAGPAPVLAAPVPAAAAITAPPLKFRMRTLANGLKVYAVQDKTSPDVSVQVWYDVGSKEDPRGRSGFAHLFEHILFKATRNMPAEMIDRLTEDVGGFNNASTADDYTNYYEVVPANHLQRILWAEAERMGALVVDEANFVSEREVVKQELRQRIFASPYGRLFGLYLVQESFSVHPYGRPGIGNIEELDAATLDDVRAFHEAFYRPDNAHLIVVGAFEDADLDRWVDAYFGPIAKPARPVPRLSVKEPPRTGARAVTTYGPNVPLPAVAMTFPSPSAADPDAAPMAVLDAILSAGESSRLYRSLVYDKQLAAEAFSFYDPGEEASIIAPGAIAAGGKSLDELEAALLAVLAELRDRPVTAAELTEAKTELTAMKLRERETVDGRGDALGRAILLAGDPHHVDREIADIQAVSVADVQRVARKYLADDQRLVIRYLDEGQRPAGQTTASTGPGPQALIVPPAVLPLTVAAPQGQRVAPPPPGPQLPVPTPTPTERRLANGLRVIVAPSGQLPLVSARVVIGAGGGEDPATRAGAAAMTATLATQGTRTRSAPEIATELEVLGAEISSGAGWDSSTLGVSAPAPGFEAAAAILAELAIAPALSPEELERQRQQALDGLDVAMRQPGSLAGLVAPRVAYGAAAYGHPLNGSPQSLTAMTAADVASFHEAWWRPGNAALVLTGAITPEAGFALAERLFGSWRAPERAQPARAASKAGPALPPRMVVVNLKDSGQAAVVTALRAVDRKDPDYYPLLVGNAVLGVGYSSRLNQEIRIKRGLSYGAGSALSARKDEGILTATTQTDNPSAAEVVFLVRAELDKLARVTVPVEELDTRKAVLIGGFGRNLGTTEGLADLLAGYVTYELPLTELQHYASSVRAVTPSRLREAVQAELDVDHPSVVVVGEADAFLEKLKADYPNLELIEAEALNLETPSLR